MNVIFQHKGGGLFGFLIKLWTRSRFNHVELEFSDGTRFSAYPKGGTQFKAPLTAFEQHQWVRVPLLIALDHEIDLRNWCHSELACRYDWAGILLTQIFPIGRHSKTKWFCSEVCAAALAPAFATIGKLKPHRISPAKLYRLMK